MLFTTYLSNLASKIIDMIVSCWSLNSLEMLPYVKSLYSLCPLKVSTFPIFKQTQNYSIWLYISNGQTKHSYIKLIWNAPVILSSRTHNHSSLSYDKRWTSNGLVRYNIYIHLMVAFTSEDIIYIDLFLIGWWRKETNTLIFRLSIYVVQRHS